MVLNSPDRPHLDPARQQLPCQPRSGPSARGFERLLCCISDLPSFIALVDQSRGIVRLGSGVAVGPLVGRPALLLSPLPLACGPLSGTSCGGRGKRGSRASAQERVYLHALQFVLGRGADLA